MTDTQTTTGCPPSALMQDYCKELSKWLAERACGICWKRKAKGKTMTEPTEALARAEYLRTVVQGEKL